jgi:hypothetical protein
VVRGPRNPHLDNIRAATQKLPNLAVGHARGEPKAEQVSIALGQGLDRTVKQSASLDRQLLLGGRLGPRARPTCEEFERPVVASRFLTQLQDDTVSDTRGNPGKLARRTISVLSQDNGGRCLRDIFRRVDAQAMISGDSFGRRATRPEIQFGLPRRHARLSSGPCYAAKLAHENWSNVMGAWFFGDSTKFWSRLQGTASASRFAPVIEAACNLLRRCQARPGDGFVIGPSTWGHDQTGLARRMTKALSRLPPGVDRFMQEPIHWGQIEPAGKRYRVVQIVYREFEHPDKAGVLFRVIDLHPF